MNMHGPRNHRIRFLRIHSIQQAVNGLVAAEPQYRRTENLLCIGVYNNLEKPAITYIEKFLLDFIKNKEELSEEGGYARTLEAAYVGANFISQVSKRRGDKKKAAIYLNYSNDFVIERKIIGDD